MKVRIQGAGTLGNLRCPYDGKTLLSFQVDDINLQDCDHYRWHLVGDDGNEEEEEEGNEEEEEEGNEEEEEEGNEEEEKWKEVLKNNHVASVSVEGGVFYLVHLEKAIEKE